MHQTTVRFGPDLWEALESECARLGVSAAQYLREAALARLAYTAGQRGEADYDRALVDAGVTPTTDGSSDDSRAGERQAQDAREASSEQRLAAAAVSAQSELAWRRAREVRAQAAALRRHGRRSVG